ncbi:hypothetical protein [Pseudomonas oryzihabitans]|uniref:Uncharacterized protein n=1 Tax=Pseudomonas oryzihabitans TaxID=47885 RepID=A0AAJ2EZ80_9PSED|nr:hypothetical protein [Pseudomonas psychrotolerans]MDR6236351.1 hypothetical protein [Pseudomonas psychrotolerans]
MTGQAWGGQALRLAVLVAVAALYGALHDQLSYALGPEYFTCLKFAQFGLLDEEIAPRWRAAQVGLLAGAAAGLPLGLVLLGWVRNRSGLGNLLWRGAAAVLLGAMSLAIVGLLLGWLALEVGHAQRVPACVQDARGFLLAAWMHDGSYLGALLGLLAFCWRSRRR